MKIIHGKKGVGTICSKVMRNMTGACLKSKDAWKAIFCSANLQCSNIARYCRLIQSHFGMCGDLPGHYNERQRDAPVYVVLFSEF